MMTTLMMMIRNWMPTTNGGAGVGELDGRRRRALAGQAVNFHLLSVIILIIIVVVTFIIIIVITRNLCNIIS